MRCEDPDERATRELPESRYTSEDATVIREFGDLDAHSAQTRLLGCACMEKSNQSLSLSKLIICILLHLVLYFPLHLIVYILVQVVRLP